MPGPLPVVAAPSESDSDCRARIPAARFTAREGARLVREGIVSMKLKLVVLLLLTALGLTGVQAQQDMETAVPGNWAAATGTLSISGNHFKLGAQSLRWDWNGGDAITVSNPGINPADVTDYYKHTCDLWIWNGTAIPGGKVRIQFMNGTTAQYWFDFYLNYVGWRHAERSFNDDMAHITNPSATFTSVQIVAPASGNGSFYIDSVNWVGNRILRVRDAQNVDITGFYSSTNTYDALSYLPDIATDTPTAIELSDLATLRSRWLASAQGGSAPSASSVASAAVSFAALNIVEDANGIRGKVLGQDTSGLEGWTPILVRDYLFGTPTASTSHDQFLQLVRQMLDQGLAYNSNEISWGGSGGYDYRDLPEALILMAPGYDATTKAQVWDMLRWTYRFGEFWTPNWIRDTDDIYTGVYQQLGALLFLPPSDAESVRMLKGFARHLEQFVIPSEGGNDAIKMDGLGFHHGAHYNAYMYSFRALSDLLYYLRGTVYQVDAVAYQRLRAAFLAMMRMSADDTGTAVGYFGNALCGRHPFSVGLPFGNDTLQRLGEWGGNISGQAADSVIAQAYNRRFGVNDYALFTPYGVEAPPDGFYQFNYSPLGIYRRANWVASMHGTEHYFWSSEIYAGANQYGRYQAYGALELLYYGGLAMSGGQLNGWDWNHPPGATTIVLPDNKLITENGYESVSSQLNFSGALSFYDGQSGLYACNFQEANFGANHNPTFVWRKSYFCFGNEIVCLGSDIANNDATNPTATTLFQGNLATHSTAITLDGSALTAFPLSSTGDSGSAHWLLDAFSTGYYVQPGSTVRISRATQTSANQDGTSAPTTADFATAWLDHGTAPAGAGYEYAVFPGTNAAGMTANATAHANSSTKPYEVIQRDTTAHVVRWKADGKIGYAIYSGTALPAATCNAGLLTAVTRPCLMMTQSGTAGDAWLSAVDPDMNFTSPGSAYGDTSVPRTFYVTLNGLWTFDTPPAGVSIAGFTTTSATTVATTTLGITTQDGFAVTMHLVPTTTPGQQTWANLGSDWNTAANWGGRLPSNDLMTDTVVFNATTVQPVLSGAYSVYAIDLNGGATLSGSGNLTLGAGGILATGSSNVISLKNITLGASQTWVEPGDLTISASIGGASGLGITKSGSGALTLSGSNTYTGVTTIKAGSGTVTVFGDQSAATGGWLIGLDAFANTTVNFAAGSNVCIAAGQQIVIGISSPVGVYGQTLNVSGTVSDAGQLVVARPAALNLNAGGVWTQSGSMSISGYGGYSSNLNVKAGSLFTYTGASTIKLNGANGGAGAAMLTIDGTVITSAGFQQTTIPASTARVTLENGGTLRLSASIPVLGTGVQFVLGTGGGVIDTNGYSASLSAGISGAGLTKTGAGTLTLGASNTYTGSTTVSAGTLSLGAATLSDTSSVTVASGAVLNLNFAGTDQVGSLTLGGTSLPAGTYSQITNPASITGPGQLRVGAASFASWASGYGLSGNPNSDANHNGIPNGVEYVLGTNPTVANIPGIVSQTVGSNLVVAFPRDPASETTGVTLFVEAGTDLNSWPLAYQIGDTTAHSSAGVTVTGNGTGPDTIAVAIALNGAPRLFTRIRVVLSGN